MPAVMSRDDRTAPFGVPAPTTTVCMRKETS